jgi:quercetin dioxygenase-like cupin family protein
MDLEEIKNSIAAKVHHITADKKVPLHQHPDKDEVFYCIKGSGFGVLENNEEELSVGKVFIVRAGTMHALRTDNDLYAASFMIPVIK